jgi:nicotinamidase/pyrazinamidase
MNSNQRFHLGRANMHVRAGNVRHALRHIQKCQFGTAANEAEKTALIIIDVQNCFLPGGTLATTDNSDKDAARLIDGIIKKMGEYTAVYVTKDSHPENHISFENRISPTHPKGDGLAPFKKRAAPHYEQSKRRWAEKTKEQDVWPKHCACTKQGGALDGYSDTNESGKLGCDLPEALQAALEDLHGLVGYVSKGFDENIDSYSAVADAMGNPTPELTHLKLPNATKKPVERSFLDHLNEARYGRIDVCGIARDKCVLWTAMDLLEYLTSPTKVSFLYDLTRPVSADVPGRDISRDDIIAMVAKAADESDSRIRDKPFKVV